MTASALSEAAVSTDSIEVLWQSAECAFCKLLLKDSSAPSYAFVPGLAASESSAIESSRRLVQEYELKDYLDGTWALRPRDLIRGPDRTILFVEYSGGQSLAQLIGNPMDIGQFLPLAVSLSVALGQLHARGLLHKDIKPANIVVDPASERAWLTGFGVASRLPRERQRPEPPEVLAGTLAYMAPEQTGRVNRSIDSRSDLYSLGVTLYEMLTGVLPFTASEPMEWVHCHIARQPAPPSDRTPGVPRSVSEITMKLLSKTAEERYQTVAGLESDLRTCLAEWRAHGRITPFALGRQDTPDRLLIPERLYGRDHEINTLLGAFDRIVAGGRPELVLVSGYSGIGKSAVVNELHKPLVPPRGLFAAGKFDQYKRDIPYATLAQAFQSLLRPLLSKSDEDLQPWRSAIHDALDPNGLLLVDLVPDLRHIIGEQPPVPALPPQEAQRRFHLMFRRFIGVFARPEHPLALFLDDLQWLDAATLDLMEDLMTRDDLQHVLLIGAYRDNEVSATHPLIRKLNSIRQAGAPLQNVVLAPLSRDDLRQMLMDSLHCDSERASPLAELLFQKTTGNPFFAIQFISTLAEEGLLSFDYVAGHWKWDLERIHAKGYTDNVVALMIGKLGRLPATTQEALKQFACMGNSANFEMLAMAYDKSTDELHDHLWEAVRAGLIFRSEDSYRFLHDRVQEAAYSLIPEGLRAAAHLRIGLLLAAHTPADKRDEAIFEIVNQLNRGSHLLSGVEDRERVAALNLTAGRRAKASTAYASALKYLEAARGLLTEETWEENYPLIFATEYLMAECELLTADKGAAEQRLSLLPGRAKNRHDLCTATRLRLTLYTTLDRCDRAVDVFLEWLRGQGTVWAKRPTREDVLQEYEHIWALLANRQIEELIDLPLIRDPDVLDTLDVFTEIVTPSILFDQHLSTLVVCRLVTLSLQHGNSDAAAFAYVWLAMFAGSRLGNYEAGWRFGQLGYDLVEKRGLIRYQARTYMSIGAMVIPWAQHVANGRELVRRAFDAAYRIGDLTFASYSWDQLITICLAVGDPLAEIQTECENGLAFARRVRFGLVIHLCGSQLGLIRSLRGATSTFGRLDHDDYSEPEVEHTLASNPNLVFAEFYYWTRKVQALVFAGDYASAAEAALKGNELYWTSAAMFETADFRLYAALAHAGAWNTASTEQKEMHFESLAAHYKAIEIWARHSPQTFENRAALVGAEVARIQGRVLDAQELYELAIRSAHLNGFVHNEALANELAGMFYRGRAYDKVATTYLRESRHCYLRWGAVGKVQQLDRLYPQIKPESIAVGGTATIQAAVEQLDLATVMKVSEAISGEMILERLIDRLLRIALEHAGAERGALVLAHGEGYRIEAEAITGRNAVSVDVRQAPLTAADLPESVFRYAQRTREPVLLHDAVKSDQFAGDAYVLEHQARSVLFLPILKQTRLLGMLYLENNLTSHVFNPGRVSILKLLASEAAISIENARLYRELALRESRIRQLVDANIIGIIIWDFQGRIVEANDALLRLVGRSREDLLARQLRWADLTATEWEEEHSGLWAQLGSSKSLQPQEMELIAKDGTPVPVLIGVAKLEDDVSHSVAFVLDLTERKRAAEARRVLELELTHAGRLATMGQLAASIAHEVNQPIGAVRNNAHAALRFLAGDNPDLDEVREALECVVSDTYRASDILGGIREQIRKAPPRKEDVDLSEAIEEVVALVRGELLKNHVLVQMRLPQGLPAIQGDRVQLQQVVLNLIVNAIEAMACVEASERELAISTELAPEDALLVTVADAGPGIGAEDRDRIFEAFVTTKEGGVGIGLSICRSIVEGHGGRLWADAHQPRGAVFRFTVPVSHPPRV